ncbi:SCP-like extracellular protein [Iocasia frigidifontis]|uniref:SCP-like extracellular protein n=1 Tax=Iocasia fonsfrigidae TaxID=2682810 RepID=A0A8A7K4Z6_9FIRM|nr:MULTISPECIES: CAP domain-containing protein [Halanaerobiaceae]AZO93816.1 SCP-like extracellular protein [Halocella sp. SP3-1]MTI59068.1 SCP-like extracellular protein [Bacillota bacterium]QTL96756.1 SCP-like extracellular protein [Iocasia fonsfrigidae]
MKKAKFLLFVLLTISLVSCSQQEQSQPVEPLQSSIFQTADVQYCRVNSSSLPVKAGASNQFGTISKLSQNDVVRVLGKIDDWYIVRLDDYRVGCIDSTQTSPVVKDGQTNNEIQAPGGGNQNNQTPQTQEPAQSGNGNTQTPPTQANNGNQANPPSNQESQLLNLVNQERRKNDLPVLKASGELNRVARVKAQDMVDNNYFSHNSPTYGSPFDMLDQFNVEYQYAGENLAKNTSVSRAHSALMRSSGHRRNILNPNFTHIGIGVKQEDNAYIYVELFTGVPQ